MRNASKKPTATSTCKNQPQNTQKPNRHWKRKRNCNHAKTTPKLGKQTKPTKSGPRQKPKSKHTWSSLKQCDCKRAFKHMQLTKQLLKHKRLLNWNRTWKYDPAILAQPTIAISTITTGKQQTCEKPQHRTENMQRKTTTNKQSIRNQTPTDNSISAPR